MLRYKIFGHIMCQRGVNLLWKGKGLNDRRDRRDLRDRREFRDLRDLRDLRDRREVAINRNVRVIPLVSKVAINRNVRVIPLVSIVSLVPLVPKVAINRKVLVLLDYACPVARNLITFVVLTIKNYGVCAVAVVYKLGRATLNHSVIFVATC